MIKLNKNTFKVGDILKIYKPNISFSIKEDEVEERIVLNSNNNIIFINHGKEQEYNSTSSISVREGTIYEIAFEALSDNDADIIVELFNSCLTVICGAPQYELDDLLNNIHYDQTKNIIPLPTYGMIYDNTPYLACKMLRIAIYDDNLKISILKYNVSQEIFYLHPMDLEPHFNDTYNYQYLLSCQLKMGYSIVVSYSILEELHLQVKASKEKPSSIDGKWNSEVVSNLEKRLASKGLNPNKKIPWLSRNIQQRPFKKEIAYSELCEWSDGQEVRDFEISIMEAVFETSYIRSQIASHSSAGKINQLCLYDVENANMLVRSILLDLSI